MIPHWLVQTVGFIVIGGTPLAVAAMVIYTIVQVWKGPR